MLKKAKPAFSISVGIMLVLVLLGIILPEGLESVTETIQVFISDKFGWYYLILVTLFTIICLVFFNHTIRKNQIGRS
ncbi:glycine betaine transporter [Piscibacillus halophilus]|uniref:Glycine betaine transporter n=1 Tax=Piscibacillus halophilus TaxID=571933 RepID=A0A1H9L8R0_9BACI|nr:glycine betaine transporter [Piscibacillus halophilus]